MHDIEELTSGLSSMVRGESSHSKISSGRRVYLIACLLFGLVLLVFLPATRNEFINYDDTVYVTENPHVQSGLTWPNLKWALTTGHAANWHPLTWLSHMIDCQIYGPRPWGHHLTSILLHALNVMLLFLALQRMTGATGRSLMVAVLFGVHPLRVESAVWIAERKDVLSGFFFMLMLLAYTEYVRQSKFQASRARLFYVLALMAFTFGLMSKPMLVTGPFVLLLLDWWPLNRISNSGTHSAHLALYLTRLLCEKVPFILLAVVSSVVTFEVQQSGTAVVNSLAFNIRVENAWISYCRYLGKLFWPKNLAVFYPYRMDWPLLTVLACAVALAVVTILAFVLARRYPFFPVGWFWYLGTLVPVIGFVQVGTQSMADRYTYIPIIGVLVVIIWGMHELAGRKRSWKIAFATVGLAAVLTCAVQTRRQIDYWRDSETIFRHSLAVTKENGVALDNLGRALGEKGRLDEAMGEFQVALKLNENDPFACGGLGVLFMKKHDYNSAAVYLQEALRLDPKNAVTHYNLGIILARERRFDEAISQFLNAVQINPDYADAHNNLGTALVMSNRFDDAILQYGEAIHLKPHNALIHKNLGVALVQKGRLDEAVKEFNEAIRLQPDFEEAKERLQAARESKSNPGSKP